MTQQEVEAGVSNSSHRTLMAGWAKTAESGAMRVKKARSSGSGSEATEHYNAYQNRVCREEKKRIPLAGVEDVWLPRPSSLALLTWRARSRGITFRKEKLFSFSVSSFLAQAASRHLSDGTLLQQPGARRPRAGRACHGPPTKLIVNGGVGRKTELGRTESQGGMRTDETERQGRRVMSKRCQCRRKRMGCSRRKRSYQCGVGVEGRCDAASEDANETGN